MDLNLLLRNLENQIFNLLENIYLNFKQDDKLDIFEENIFLFFLKQEKNLLTNSTIILLVYNLIQNLEKNEEEFVIKLKKQLIIEINSLLLKLKLIENFENNYDEDFFSRIIQKNILPFEKIVFDDINFIEVFEGVNFILKENNPYFKNEISLGSIKLEKWINEISSALSYIYFETPEIFNIIIPFLDTIAPIGFENYHQNSLSLIFTPKTIYLSYVEDYVVQAEAIIHEVFHSIIAVFSYFDSGVKNDFEEKYYSSVQKIPRPIQNCILALHAFVGVEDFYTILIKNKKLSEEQYYLRLFKIFNINEELILVIGKYADFTILGKDFYNQILKNHQFNKNFILEFKNKNENNNNLFIQMKNLILEHKKNVIKNFPEILY